MLKRMFMTWLGASLTLSIVLAGCSNDVTGDPGSTGALEMTLELAGNLQIDEVWYNITGNGMAPMSGFVDTSAAGATASVEVFGIPPGDDYSIELRAIVDDGTSCQGSAEFDVVAGLATPVAVMLNCKPPERFGSVRVNGTLNVCADLMKVVVAPLQTSVGSEIALSAQGVDAEGDPVSYFWSATGGPVADPEQPVTAYTCVSSGRQFVQVYVSDDEFADCIDTWEVEVRCVSGDGGTGGSGGTAGTGGAAPECTPSSFSCSNGEIDPIVEDPACSLNEPPTLVDRCTGNESVVNPVSCTATGNQTMHAVQLISVAGDCNAGFDLDRCDGISCVLGGLAPGEGVDGVDNALAGLAPVLSGVGANLGGIDQVLYDGLCDGSIDWVFVVDPNPEEGCITVTPVYDGSAAAPVPMNLSETGCVSGTLGTVPVTIAGVPGALENAALRGTADVARGFDLLLGATVADDTAKAIADALIQGGSAVVAQVFDINSDLEGDLTSGCDALSLSLDVGGTLVRVPTEGACTDTDNSAVYAKLVYTDDDGESLSGPAAASAISSDCVFGSVSSEPTLPGCATTAAEVIRCAIPQDCTDEVIAEFSSCVEECAQEAIAQVTGSRLSEDCSSCYGENASCTLERCVTSGCSNPNSSSCIQCRCDNDCIPAFDRCSGLAPTGECE